MANVMLLTGLLSSLEKSREVLPELNMLLDECADEYGLKSVYIYETDFDYFMSTPLYWWEKARLQGDSRPYGPGEADRKSFMLSGRDARQLKKLLSENDSLELDGGTDETLRSAVSSASGVREGRYLVCPLYKDRSVSGFFLYGLEEMQTLTEDERSVLKIASGMLAVYISRIDSDEASKMKTEFLSRMSHEIRTPMNAIIGMTAIARSSLDDIDRVSDCLVKIDASTKYLLSLVNDVLDMSKIESGKLSLNIERFSMDSMLRGLEALLAPQAEERNIKLRIIREYSDKYVYGDELKLNQVLINLLGNALKFTPEGGRIVLRVEEILAEDNDVVMRFFVRDNGIGIEDKNLYRIFKAFEQAEDDTSKNYGGTGLGLSISYNLVKLMGGILKVDSTIGRGSDFYFTISFKSKLEDGSEIAASRDGDKPEEEYDFSGRRALIAEDNELNAEIAQTILEMVGFETELAENGRVAVDKFLENDEGYYDVILMDVRMPVMDGLEAARAIRASSRKYGCSVPILAMTANAFDEDMKKSIRSGMNGHLSKPVDTEKLYRELKRLIA